MRLTPKLAAVGMMAGGAFSFTDIRAMGLTGIVFDDVVFTPKAEGMPPVHFESVTVYPDLPGMFVGDLNASLVEVRGMDAVLHLEDGASAEWFRNLLHRAEDDRRAGVVTSMSELDGGRRHIPRLVCESCSIDVYWDAEQHARIQIPRYSAEIETAGEIRLDGKPARVCLYSPGEVCFEAVADAVRFGDSIQVSNLEITDAALSDMHLSRLVLHDVEFARNDQRNVLFVEEGRAEFAAEAGGIDFRQLEMLHERRSERIGIGVALRDTAGGNARIFGGYSPAERKIAVTFDAQGIDIADIAGHRDAFDWLHFDSLPVSGRAHITMDFERRIVWGDADIEVEKAGFTAPALSSTALRGVETRLSGRYWADWGNGHFLVEDGVASIREIPCRFGASRMPVEEGDHRILAHLECAGDSASFVGSLPEGFAPTLSGYRLEGPYAFSIDVGYDENRLDDLALTVDFELDDVKTIAYDPRSDFTLIKGDAFQVRVNAATVPIVIGPREKGWVKFSDLPRETAYAFVASEDGRFFSHPGFDIRAIRASLIADLKADRIVRGGSTISQQVVKNLFLNHDKTIARKFQEAFLTWQMERTVPKMRIFEIYLNLAHWAKDTYGIRAAAEYYFRKKVSELTLRESLFLAAILPNPIIFGRQYAEGKLSESRLTKMLNVGTALRARDRISEEAWEAAVPFIKQGIISDRPRPTVQ